MQNQTLVKEICPTTTQARIKSGAVLVDVREMEEVAALAFDVPQLLHIPLSEFEERYHEIPKDKAVVMVCKVGAKSLRAAGFLIHYGYDREKVRNMQYGLVRWVQKGFSVKGDTDAFLALQNSCCSTSGCC